MIGIISNKKGMTIVEVVVSIALTALVLTSIIALITQGSVFSKSIDIVYTGTYIAQRRIDLLKRLSFDELAGAAETDIRIGADGNANSKGYYLRTTEVTENYDSNEYLTKVKVSVKRAKVDINGGILDSNGNATFIGEPIVLEGLFCDI